MATTRECVTAVLVPPGDQRVPPVLTGDNHGKTGAGTMTRKADREAAQEAARAELRDMFPVGSTVRVRLEHVSRSGMARDIAVMGPDGTNVSRLVAAAGERMSPYREAIRVGGCGMDMGFALVYSMASGMYRDAFACIGDRCPSNDHTNEWRTPDYTPGRLHSDAGYALGHRWVS